MIIVPGQAGKDLCDPQLGMTRRDILRVGGSGLLGLSLGSMLELQAVSARAADVTGGKTGGAPGWGKAKSIIMVYLGPRAHRPRRLEDRIWRGACGGASR